MRRVAALGLAGALVLVLAACARPAGVDGDLTNGWSSFPAGQPVKPQVGACYEFWEGTTWSIAVDPPVGCDTEHDYETVFVGAFTGGDATRADAPPAGGSGQRAAYAQCTKPANDVLGTDWRDLDLQLLLVLPTQAAWEGGARWFACDLIEPDGHGQASTLSSPVKSLAASLRRSCRNVTENPDNTQITGETPIDCSSAHRAEYAGFWTPPDTPYPSGNSTLGEHECEKVVAGYVGLGSQMTRGDMGWYVSWESKDRWELGDRTVRCYALLVPGKSVVGSLKGIGNKPLPH